MTHHSGSNLVAQLHEVGFVHADPPAKGWTAYLNPALGARLWIPAISQPPLWLGVAAGSARQAVAAVAQRVLPGAVIADRWVLASESSNEPSIADGAAHEPTQNEKAAEGEIALRKVPPVPAPDAHVFHAASFQEFVELLQIVASALATDAQSPAPEDAANTPAAAPAPNPELDRATQLLLGDEAELSSTELLRLAVARRGQDVFRQKLVDYWGGRCALTGITDLPLLRASHIRPWAQCETAAQRLDVHNGILLAAHLDAAFDQGLLTFDETGCCVLSPRLSKAGRALFQEWAGVRVLGITAAHQVYLGWHRAGVFLG